MPLIITPKPLSHPEIPYDRVMVSLSISPIVRGTDIDAAMSMTATPYRTLPDGEIETREDLRQYFNSGQVFVDAQSDPALAVAATAVWDAIQTFLVAKGA